MTNTNTNLNIKTQSVTADASEELHVPLLLKPAGKDYLWGGTRLRDDFAKDFDFNPLAETWECSTHPDGQSLVASGMYEGQYLKDVLESHPEFIGTHPQMMDGLPVLIKFIDAKGDLSVQVHPTDEYAAEYENGSLGKTEMWYVVEAAKDAHLVYGFRHDMSREDVAQSLKEESLENYLQKIPVKKGDMFFIPAGQVHAICAGCLVAEVQESSNLTYRLYDYNRIDKTGKKRELHVEKALDVMNYNSSAVPRRPMSVIRFRKGIMIESLCHCKYFQVEKITVDTQRCKELAWFKTRSNSFRVLLCMEGCGSIRWHGGGMDFFRGDCVFVPADSVDYCIHGEAKLLRVSC